MDLTVPCVVLQKINQVILLSPHYTNHGFNYIMCGIKKIKMYCYHLIIPIMDLIVPCVVLQKIKQEVLLSPHYTNHGSNCTLCGITKDKPRGIVITALYQYWI